MIKLAPHPVRQSLSSKLFAWVAASIFSVIFLANISVADELIVEESNDTLVKTGDFEWRACKEPIVSGLNLVEGLGTTGEITTGQLYKFFKSQGFESVDRLVLCVDIDNALRSDVGLDEFVVTIEDPFRSTNFGSFSLDRDGDNSLIMPGYETSMLKPEAQLEIPLGYDFMQRFSENSKEVVKLNFQTSGDKKTVPVTVYFPETRSISWFSGPRLLIVLLFAAFWAAVFWALVRFTLPKGGAAQAPNV